MKTNLLICTAELMRMLSIKSPSTIYENMKKGLLPEPVDTPSRTLMWSENEVREWMLNRPLAEMCDDSNRYIASTEITDKTVVRFIDLLEVRRLVAKMSPTTLYEWMKQGKFPCKRKILSRKVGWLEHEVLEWIDIHSRTI